MSTPTNIDLYYTPASGPCRTVLITIKALDLKVNLKPMNLRNREQFTPEFLTLNPQHIVPTIVDNGFVLWESRAIILYLIEKYAKDDSLYPKDLEKRSRINQRLYFDATILLPTFRGAYYPLMFPGMPNGATERMRKVNDAFNLLNTFLGDNDYIIGNKFTVADFNLAATTSSFEAADFDFNKYPKVKKWLERCKTNIPGFEEANKGVIELKQALSRSRRSI